MLAGRGTPLGRQVALDLVRAEAWRADWQLRAAAILDGSHEWQFRRLAVGPVVVRACERFAAGSRLNGIDLAPDVSDWSASAVLDEEAVICAVAGAVIATAGLTEGAASRSCRLPLAGRRTIGSRSRWRRTASRLGWLFCRLFEVQVTRHKELQSKARQFSQSTRILEASRGKILDRNGRGTALQFSLSR
jgi:hypothetical protein